MGGGAREGSLGPERPRAGELPAASAAPGPRIAVRRLGLRLRGVSPSVARELALGVARELAAAAPTAAGLAPRVRIESTVTDPARLARRLAAALVRPRSPGRD
jgi:hypothetical protein